MIKLHGFGGKTEFWYHNLESFTLMAGLAALTTKIKLFAWTAIPTLPPALVARMATTIDSIAQGRFRINIVTGWQMTEYDQISIWPGNEYFGYRYDYATEYVKVVKELWADGKSDFKGKHFTMNDCKMLPKPSKDIQIVAAGQSGRDMEFASKFADFNFILGSGTNTPNAIAPANERLIEATTKSKRDVGSYVLFIVIAEETDEEAQKKRDFY